MGLAAVSLFGLAACNKLGGGSDEMSFAKAALERNDRIEIVATDPATNTFTIRVKGTDTLQTVRADQVVGGIPGLTAPAGAAGSAGTTASAEPAPAESATASNTEQGQAAGDTAQSSTPGGAATNGAQANAASTNAAPGAANRAIIHTGPGDVAPPNTAIRASDTSASVPRTGFQPSAAPQSEVPNPNSDVA